jgi:diguanylate cyclase (GGDEF)-like protein
MVGTGTCAQLPPVTARRLPPGRTQFQDAAARPEGAHPDAVGSVRGAPGTLLGRGFRSWASGMTEAPWRVTRLDEFIVGGALCCGPLSALLWSSFAGPSTPQVVALLVFSAAGLLFGLPLLLGRLHRATVRLVQAVLAGYAVVLCGVAFVLGEALSSPPFFSYLIWALPPAFVVLPLQRAVAHSVWVTACIVVVELLTQPEVGRVEEVARVGLILTAQAVAATALALLASRGRRAAAHQRRLAEFGSRALVIDDHGALLVDAHGVAQELAGGPVRFSNDAAADGEVQIALRPGDPASPAWAMPQRKTLWHSTEDDLPLLESLAAMTTAANDRLAELARTEHAALHDSLTGLPNRALGMDRLERLLARRTSRGIAVLLIDLDEFKQINDGYGHIAGDRLLQELARRLVLAVRPQDTVARLGGDEFLVIADDVHSVAEARALAARLGTAWEQPYRLDAAEVFVTGSIGIAVTVAPDRPPNDDTPAADHAAELLREADTAMYHAKGRGRGGVALYDEAARQAAIRRLGLESDLRTAVADEGFHLVYQPIVDLSDGAPVAVETLLRWTHARYGEMRPAEFIPITEQLGLIRPLGQLVLRQAMDVAVDWHDRGLRHHGAPIGFTVNVSPVQLDDPQFLVSLEKLVVRTGVPPGTLGIEITEGVFLRDPYVARRILDAARGIGVRVLLDDFGTGYSSLTYLQEFAPDAIKIDRSFVVRLGRDSRARAIVSAVGALGRDLGVVVVAEGIETEDQRALLLDLHVTQGQGFGLARPLPREEAYALVAHGHHALRPPGGERPERG